MAKTPVGPTICECSQVLWIFVVVPDRYQRTVAMPARLGVHQPVGDRQMPLVFAREGGDAVKPRRNGRIDHEHDIALFHGEELYHTSQ